MTDHIGIAALTELALDMRWSWDHAADELWAQLNPELWKLTNNPWLVLHNASPARVREFVERSDVRPLVDSLIERRRRYLAAPAWYQQTHPRSPLNRVAYFSMEFALSEALPIYSGGLGNVAGDQLKAASDLGVPVIGVGLLYQQGYFRQAIAADGHQEALYPFNDPDQLPIAETRDKDGEVLRLTVRLPGYEVWVRVWQVCIGRAFLYLLDTNDAANPPVIRSITSELYGGGPELRLRQELLLGIGGWRLLRTLGLDVEVCHLNEGHAAFAVLERARTFMEDTGQPFAAALAATRAGNLFTTHTPVPAGFDSFEPRLIELYLRRYTETRLAISMRDLLALGRRNPDDSAEPFNMAYLAMRGCAAVNGVSRLHGSVSRRIFQPLFPRWPEAEVPVGYVTNGIHTPSWCGPAAEALWTSVGGFDAPSAKPDGDDLDASDEQLWALRNSARCNLVEYVRSRIGQQVASMGVPLDAAETIAGALDPDALTLGFARRFATYKRPNLLLRDPDRLLRILADPARRVQLVIAGKAHPADTLGQDLIRQWIQFILRPEARAHVVFIADYDLLVAEQLVRGVDVWLNTPRRPWEASGTSGMKVLGNGGLNTSALDGWWAEAYEPDVGWALGDGREHGDDPAADAADAETLYSILEREIIPAFYDRDSRGVPHRWVARMRASMARLTKRFSANRVVREYTDTFYVRAAESYGARAAGDGRLGAELAAWESALAASWGDARFGEVRVSKGSDGYRFTVDVRLGRIDPGAVRVELFASGSSAGDSERHPMARGNAISGPEQAYEYEVNIPATRPANDYTPRLVPYHAAAAVPLEAAEILWQH